ncbi:helix-turn-helix domain-containing protein [Halodesulfurarchaeum formicicum]|uniref:Transcriptional regulator n=1 Tax=Halodesulfurarchaeum formicicum TaxID=1873524 RepID=A0A1J1AB29_9EURY|nr:helix-turn-helix domain-containing protein [Halodesulfurarchaeum formicicum]APE94943.1 transcriptional regulator [Halodesulfurarchaeum formicicum]
MDDPRTGLAERIAGEVTLSDEPGETLRKWRTDFEVSQTDLARELEVSPSVVSDYESGRRASPGADLVARFVRALLAIDERRGGEHARQFARVLSAGFDSDVVLDLREYSRSVPLAQFYDHIGATEVAAGDRSAISGHTVIDSIRAIAELPSEEFYRLYGQSTNRVLGFTNVTRGESPLVALRVVNPKPNAVLLCGIEESDLWEHAPDLARRDGVSLAVTPLEPETLRARLREFP